MHAFGLVVVGLLCKPGEGGGAFEVDYHYSITKKGIMPASYSNVFLELIKYGTYRLGPGKKEK